MEHRWTVEEVNCGTLGGCEFWVCEKCHESGGPYWYKAKEPTPYFVKNTICTEVKDEH